MNEDIARVVYPLIGQALSLRDRLEEGEFLDIDFEQTTLKEMLRSNAELLDRPDFSDEPLPFSQAPFSAVRAPNAFLGIRYALVCWLDELLASYSGWVSGSWQEHTLEMALYGASDGPWKFWEQARLSEKRSSCEALEVFYLCVMLGFRGELATSTDQIRDWVQGARAKLESGATIDWLDPPELEPVRNVAPLRGREKLQRLVLMAGSVFLVLVPVAAFFLVRKLGH